MIFFKLITPAKTYGFLIWLILIWKDSFLSGFWHILYYNFYDRRLRFCSLNETFQWGEIFIRLGLNRQGHWTKPLKFCALLEQSSIFGRNRTYPAGNQGSEILNWIGYPEFHILLQPVLDLHQIVSFVTCSSGIVLRFICNLLDCR